MPARTSRQLPHDLVERLRRTRELEQLAETEQQRQRTIYATTRLVAAAVQAARRVSELAAPLGMTRGTLSKRINNARRAGRDHPTGLVVDAPLEPRPPLHEFTSPVEQRDRPAPSGGWSDRGLLQHTRIVGKRWRGPYLRADLFGLR